MTALCQSEKTQKNNKISVNKSPGSSLWPQPNLIYSWARRRQETGKRWNMPPPQPQIRKPQGELHMDVGIPSRRTVAKDRQRTIQFGQGSNWTDLDHLQEQIELEVTYMIH